MARSSNIIFDILARDKTKSGVDKAKASMKVASTAILASVGALTASSVAKASDLSESINAVNVSYGDAATAVAKLGEQSATSLGLSNTEFNGLAVRFSAFAQTIAGDGGDVVSTLDDLTVRSADFASVMNMDVAEASQLFQSGLAGESEPLRKFGIDMSAASIEAYALANGIWDGTGKMTEAMKVQARYGSLMEQTEKTAGDFANTSDGLANSQRIMKASFEDVQANLGMALLPTIAAVSTKVAALTGWFKENQGVANVLVGVVAALAAVMLAASVSQQVWNAIMIAGKVATAAATAAQWLFNAALSANPIGIIIVAIAALVAALVWFFTKTETGKKIWAGFTEFLGKAWENIKKWFAAGWAAVKKYLGLAWDFIKKVWSFSPLGLIVTNWDKIVDFFKKMPGRITRAASGLWDGIKDSFKASINWLIKQWNDFGITLGGGTVLGVKVPSVTLDTPDIPYLASGGTIAKGGLAVVGERGPEIVSLPTGSRVHPNGYAPAGLGDGVTRIHPDDIEAIITGLFRSITTGASNAVASNERMRARVAGGLA